MITKDSNLEFQNIPICDIRVTEYQVRYPEQLQRYIELMLASPDDAPGFILVKRMSDCLSTYEVLDGHHRFVAHIMTGRQTALCIVIEEPNEPRTDDQGNREALRPVISAQAGVDVGRSGVRDLQQEGVEALNRAWARMHDTKKSTIVGADQTFNDALNQLITEENQEKIR